MGLWISPWRIHLFRFAGVPPQVAGKVGEKKGAGRVILDLAISSQASNKGTYIYLEEPFSLASSVKAWRIHIRFKYVVCIWGGNSICLLSSFLQLLSCPLPPCSAEHSTGKCLSPGWGGQPCQQDNVLWEDGVLGGPLTHGLSWSLLTS